MMKRLLILMMCLLLVFVVGCSKENNTENNNANDSNLEIEEPIEVVDKSIEEITRTFNEDIAAMAVDNLLNNYTYSAEMIEFMTKETLEDLFNQMDLGHVIERREQITQNVDEYRVVSTPTIFENKRYTVNVVFDENNLISGFNFGEFLDDSEKVIIEDSIETIALKHHSDFSDEQYDSLMNNYVYSPEMLAAINEVMLKEMKEGLDTGALMEVNESFTFEAQGYTIVSLPVVYENISLNYNVVFNDDKVIEGLSFADYQEKVTVVMPSTIKETTIVAAVNDLGLEGILTTPAEGDSFPCVIFVHGSGATDKDETIFNNKPFRDLAWGLAERGIASYRYDKRNYAYPEQFTEATITLYDETINDASEIFKMVQNFENIEYDSVYILGHSLGGYAMPLIAQDTEANGYIIMAGSTRPLEVLILEQVEYLARLDGDFSEEDQNYLASYQSEIDKLNNLDVLTDSTYIMGAPKSYWAFLQTYDPIDVAKDMNEKVLVLQGKRDYQVTLKDYDRWFNAFGTNDNWSFRLYDQLNHLMMPGEGQPSNVEYTSVNYVDTQVIEDIANWIND